MKGTANRSSRRAVLVRSIDELRDRLDRIRRQPAEAPLDPDFSEQAVQRENDEVLAQLQAETEKMLLDSERALGRLDRGEAEHCSQCGAVIAPARLAAMPYANECLDCASAALVDAHLTQARIAV
jgi:DnaK suppressor protein